MVTSPNSSDVPAVTASARVGIVPTAVYGPEPLIVTGTVMVLPWLSVSVTGDTGALAKLVAVNVNSVPGWRVSLVVTDAGKTGALTVGLSASSFGTVPLTASADPGVSAHAFTNELSVIG